MRMKKIVLTVFLGFLAFATKAQISSVKIEGNYGYIYGENGKQTATFYGAGDLIGYSSSIVAMYRNGDVYIYNDHGKEIKRFYPQGKPISVNSQKIVCKKGNYTYVYDAISGRRIKTY